MERARPYARVDHRSFDSQLRSELAIAAERAASIPPVLSTLAIGLSTTAGLAAAVAGNATDDEFALLAEQDSQRRPLSSAVHLIAEGNRMAGKRGREAAQVSTATALTSLWNGVDWSDPGVYDEDDANGHSMFWLGSHFTSPENVRKELASALGHNPEFLLPLVAACAPWTEFADSDDWQTTACQRRYRDLPPWFPVEAVEEAAAAGETRAHTIRVDDFGDTDADDLESLLAQVLWHAQRSPRAEEGQ